MSTGPIKLPPPLCVKSQTVLQFFPLCWRSFLLSHRMDKGCFPSSWLEQLKLVPHFWGAENTNLQSSGSNLCDFSAWKALDQPCPGRSWRSCRLCVRGGASLMTALLCPQLPAAVDQTAATSVTGLSKTRDKQQLDIFHPRGQQRLLGRQGGRFMRALGWQ